MKKMIGSVLAAVLVVTSCPVSVSAAPLSEGTAESGLSSGEYLYENLSDGSVAVTGYTGGSEDNADELYLEIPSEIEGMPVTKISEEAFAYNQELTAVLVPDSIISVDNAVFYHCENLKVIAFEGKAPTLGFTIVEGCHALEKIMALEESDISGFCALLVSDIGEDRAKEVEVAEYADVEVLKKSFEEYVEALCTPSLETQEAESVVEQPEAKVEEVDSPEPIEESVAAEGVCGADLTWTLNTNGVLTVSGTGAMTSYTQGKAPWYSYKDSITTLVLEDGLTNLKKLCINHYSLQWLNTVLELKSKIETPVILATDNLEFNL